MSFAPGKIILSGEYAVLFGYAGIAVPATVGIEAVFEEDRADKKILIDWEDGGPWLPYVAKMIGLFREKNTDLHGKLTIHSALPLGKGMGSSTALVIAAGRALLGENSREATLEIEDALNPGHSGFDF